MRNTYIVASVRTAVGKAPRGTLRHMRPDDMGAAAVGGAIAKCHPIPVIQKYLLPWNPPLVLSAAINHCLGKLL